MNKIESRQDVENLLSNLDFDDAYLQAFNSKWDTYHNDDGIVNFQSPPTIHIELVCPSVGKKLTLNLLEVNKSTFNLLGSVNLTIRANLSSFQIYLNERDSFESNFIECRSIEYKLEDYEVPEAC